VIFAPGSSPVRHTLQTPTFLAMFGPQRQRERCQHGYRHSVEQSDLLSHPVPRRLHDGAHHPGSRSDQPPKPRLPNRIPEAIRTRHYNLGAEKAYVHCPQPRLPDVPLMHSGAGNTSGWPRSPR
jgi:hypothetical protein